MGNIPETRIYGKNVDIDSNAVKNLYSARSEKNGDRPVDAPTVLSSDTNIENIELWTKEELERWFPQFALDNESIVLEIGFGTGRMTRYITPKAGEYVGIDYVKEFVDTVKKREDIVKKENTVFLHMPLEQFAAENHSRYSKRFNRLFLSGGVFMYMNDCTLKECMAHLADMLQESCVMYISEPVAIEERLTLNSFYSETIQDNYSAIYRTVDEYRELFSPFLNQGFALDVCQEFFENDIKKMKETKQWIFILKRTKRG